MDLRKLLLSMLLSTAVLLGWQAWMRHAREAAAADLIVCLDRDFMAKPMPARETAVWIVRDGLFDVTEEDLFRRVIGRDEVRLLASIDGNFLENAALSRIDGTPNQALRELREIPANVLQPMLLREARLSVHEYVRQAEPLLKGCGYATENWVLYRREALP